MKIQRILVALALLSWTPLSSFAASLGHIRVSMMEGDVQARTAESGEWVPTSVNTPLAEGDELWVPEGGRLELQLNEGTYIRLDQDSALEILSTDSDASQVYLSKGRSYVYFDGKADSVLQFDTPQISARARDRCSFGVDLSDDYTDVSVYKGTLDVENQAGSTRLNAGKMLSLAQETEAETAPLGPPDDWELWNRKRNDHLLDQGPSVRYLPSELRPFCSDFDRGGRWVEAREYGRVWTPADAADPSWSPYRNGRWMWRGGDYVWVGYEPWGWAPYHYGRWAFAPPFGWFWVPPPPKAVIWGPGFVGWVRTPEYVAWVPLAPREVYYGRGDYGPNSVNVTRVNVTNIRVTNVYRNGEVRNGVTVVHHNTFVSGAPPPMPFNPEGIRKKIFTKQNMIFGRPPIDPVRASFMPIIKAIPPPFRPPPAVEKIRVDTVRRSRPLVKHSQESVLKPGTVAPPLPVKVVPAPRPRPDRPTDRERQRGDKNKGDDRGRDRMQRPEDVQRPAMEPGKPEVVEERKPPKGKKGGQPKGDEGPVAPTQRPEDVRRPAMEQGKPEVFEEKKPRKGKQRIQPKGDEGPVVPEAAPKLDRGQPRDRPAASEADQPKKKEKKEKRDQSEGRPEKLGPLPAEEGGRARTGRDRPADLRREEGVSPDRGAEPDLKRSDKPQKSKDKGKGAPEDDGSRGEEERGRPRRPGD